MRQICIIKCSQSYDEIHEVAQIIGQYNRLHRKCRAEFFHFRHFLLGHAGYIPHTHTRTHTSKRNTQETFTKRQGERTITAPYSGALLAHAAAMQESGYSSTPLAHTHHRAVVYAIRRRRSTMRSDRGSRVAADKRRVGRKNAPCVSVKRWH